MYIHVTMFLPLLSTTSCPRSIPRHRGYIDHSVYSALLCLFCWACLSTRIILIRCSTNSWSCSTSVSPQILYLSSSAFLWWWACCIKWHFRGNMYWLGPPRQKAFVIRCIRKWGPELPQICLLAGPMGSGHYQPQTTWGHHHVGFPCRGNKIALP